MSLKHVYVVKRTDYKHREDPEVEDESSLLGVHLTRESAIKGAISAAKEYPHEDDWDSVDKEMIAVPGGGYRITCHLNAYDIHDTDHFVIEVEKVMVEEGMYEDEGDEEEEEEDDDEDDDEVEEVAEPAAKRKRT